MLIEIVSTKHKIVYLKMTKNTALIMAEVWQNLYLQSRYKY